MAKYLFAIAIFFNPTQFAFSSEKAQQPLFRHFLITLKKGYRGTDFLKTKGLPKKTKIVATSDPFIWIETPYSLSDAEIEYLKKSPSISNIVKDRIGKFQSQECTSPFSPNLEKISDLLKQAPCTPLETCPKAKTTKGLGKLWIDADLMMDEVLKIQPPIHPKVAITDSGLDPNFSNQFQNSVQFGTLIEKFDGDRKIDPSNVDKVGHGTAVASIIASKPTSIGIAPNTQIKMSSASTWGKVSLIAAFLEAKDSCDQGYSVINMSLGSLFDTYTNDSKNTLEIEMKDVLTYLKEKGCIVVLAAGNDSYKRTMKTDSDDALLRVSAFYPKISSQAKFSNSGEIMAPGEEIDALVPPNSEMGKNSSKGECGDQTTILVNGTSFAAPIIAAIMGEVRAILDQNKDFKNASGSNKIKIINRILIASQLNGGVNALRAVVLAKNFKSQWTKNIPNIESFKKHLETSQQTACSQRAKAASCEITKDCDQFAICLKNARRSAALCPNSKVISEHVKLSLEQIGAMDLSLRYEGSNNAPDSLQKTLDTWKTNDQAPSLFVKLAKIANQTEDEEIKKRILASLLDPQLFQTNEGVFKAFQEQIIKTKLVDIIDLNSLNDPLCLSCRTTAGKIFEHKTHPSSQDADIFLNDIKNHSGKTMDDRFFRASIMENLFKSNLSQQEKDLLLKRLTDLGYGEQGIYHWANAFKPDSPSKIKHVFNMLENNGFDSKTLPLLAASIPKKSDAAATELIKKAVQSKNQEILNNVLINIHFNRTFSSTEAYYANIKPFLQQLPSSSPALLNSVNQMLGQGILSSLPQNKAKELHSILMQRTDRDDALNATLMNDHVLKSSLGIEQGRKILLKFIDSSVKIEEKTFVAIVSGGDSFWKDEAEYRSSIQKTIEKSGGLSIDSPEKGSALFNLYHRDLLTHEQMYTVVQNILSTSTLDPNLICQASSVFNDLTSQQQKNLMSIAEKRFLANPEQAGNCASIFGK